MTVGRHKRAITASYGVGNDLHQPYNDSQIEQKNSEYLHKDINYEEL